MSVGRLGDQPYHPSFSDPANPKRNAGTDRRGSYNTDYSTGYEYKDGQFLQETRRNIDSRFYKQPLSNPYNPEANRQVELQQQIEEKKWRDQQQKMKERYEDQMWEETLQKQNDRLKNEYQNEMEMLKRKEEEKTKKVQARIAALEAARKKADDEKRAAIDQKRLLGQQARAAEELKKQRAIEAQQKKQNIPPESTSTLTPEEADMAKLKLDDSPGRSSPYYSAYYNSNDNDKQMPKHINLDTKKRRVPNNRGPDSPLKPETKLIEHENTRNEYSMKRKNPDYIPSSFELRERERDQYSRNSTPDRNKLSTSYESPKKETSEIEVQTEWDDFEPEDKNKDQSEKEKPQKPRSPSPPPFDWKIQLKEPDEEFKNKIQEMSKEDLQNFERENPDLRSQIRAMKKNLRAGDASPSPERENSPSPERKSTGSKTPEWLQSKPNTPQSRSQTAPQVKSPGFERTPSPGRTASTRRTSRRSPSPKRSPSPRRTSRRSPTPRRTPTSRRSPTPRRTQTSRRSPTPRRTPTSRRSPTPRRTPTSRRSPTPGRRSTSGRSPSPRRRTPTPDDKKDGDLWLRPESEDVNLSARRQKKDKFDLNVTHGTMLKNFMKKANGMPEVEDDDYRKDSPDQRSSVVTRNATRNHLSAGDRRNPTSRRTPDRRDRTPDRRDRTPDRRDRTPDRRDQTPASRKETLDLDVTDNTLLRNYVRQKKGTR